MGDKSSIEWTEATWNPTTGCDRTSPGCDNCYALTLAKRLKAMGQPKYQNDGDPRTSGPGFGLTLHVDAISMPLAWRDPRVIFVNSMSDLFHANVPLEFIRRVFDVMERTPHHTYQVLTKRSKRLAQLAEKLDWPANVWMGVSVESDSYAFRADHLRGVPAAVRFLSVEPLIGAVPSLGFEEIDWVIVGGESGHRARPLDIAWVLDVQKRATAAGAAFFLKQLGSVWARENGYRGKAHQMDQWPRNLRVRAMPAGGVSPVGELVAT
ncbi:MAG TPA: phage Gp37/Gp68 family protein [Acidimicrobiales bacterium]|nr:phage Gp37/Gp68 family protein [Acidimicrobiales bacterium]